MRAGESAEELRLKEERLEHVRAAQRRKEAEAKRKAEVRMPSHARVDGIYQHSYASHCYQPAAQLQAGVRIAG
jgi:hypothetical protein